MASVPAKVLKYETKRQRGEREAVAALFEQFTNIRLAVREAVEHYTIQKRRQGRRPHYDRSSFYIGKGVTRIVFKNLYVPLARMRAVSQYLETNLSNAYTYIFLGRDLMVYLRDENEVSSKIRRD